MQEELVRLYKEDWIARLYYEEMLRNTTERTRDKYKRYDGSVEKDREGNRRISNGMQTQTSNNKDVESR